MDTQPTQTPNQLPPVQPVLPAQPQPVASAPEPQKKSKPVLLVLLVSGLLLAVAGGAYWLGLQSVSPQQITEMPATEQNSIQQEDLVAEQPNTSPVVSSTECAPGTTLQETTDYSICLPERFVQNSFNRIELGDNVERLNAEYTSPVNNEKLVVHRNFEGGWGGNPCMVVEERTWMNRAATFMQNRDVVSSTGMDDPNPVCGESKELFLSLKEGEWSLNTISESTIDVEEFLQYSSTFTLK